MRHFVGLIGMAQGHVLLQSISLREFPIAFTARILFGVQRHMLQLYVIGQREFVAVRLVAYGAPGKNEMFIFTSLSQ